MKKTFTLTNGDIANIGRSLQKLETSTGNSAKFKLAVAINRNILKPSYLLIEEAHKISEPDPKFVEFQHIYLSLLKQLEADRVGFAKEFEKEVENLKVEYHKELVERDEQIKELNAFLMESQEVELQTLTVDDIEDALSTLDQKTVTPADFTNLIALTE